MVSRYFGMYIQNKTKEWKKARETFTKKDWGRDGTCLKAVEFLWKKERQRKKEKEKEKEKEKVLGMGCLLLSVGIGTLGYCVEEEERSKGGIFFLVFMQFIFV